MDSTSNTVEKVLETKNGTEELHADVLASEDNGNSVETPLELSSDSDLDKPNSRTDDIDDADLIIEDKESKNCSLKSENTDTVVEKPSIPVGSLDTDTTANTDEKESKDLNIEQSPVKTDTTITLENSVIANTKNEKPPIVSDDNQNVAVIKDENCIIVSTSNAENSSVPQGTSNIQVEDEDEEVQKTEKTVLQDCTENLTEEGIIETTSTKSELAGETTKPEVDLPIEHGIIETTNTTSDLAGETTKPEVDLPIEHDKNLAVLEHRSVTNKDANFSQEGKEEEEITDQSELLKEKPKETEHLRSDQNEFNNQILDIISDIDINIKAQEKITQLQEQELKLIRKQNELANQIQQQQILAQRLNANNQFKPSQGSQSANFDSQSQQQNKRDVLVSVTPQNTAGNETTNTSKTVDLRKIFTPATDSSEILPKNRKLYASSAFYSPTLHPTVEDQVELARRISHSLSDISNQTSKGQSMYVNRKKRSDKWVHEGRSQDYQQYQQKPILPNILPAYSDAGKHRVQLNLHQNQLIEKYSKPGLQVVKSPWEAALQTGSASSAFLEDNNSQCFSPAVTPTSYFHGGYNDIPDAEQPTHYTTQRQQQNVNPAPPQSINVPSNPKRDLAYTPCVAQGWGGHNVELPKGLYVPKEISLSSYAAPPKQYGGHEENFKLPSYESLSRPLPMTNFVANENSITGSSEFPLTKPLTTGFSTLPPNQKPYSPYKKIPVRSECFAPQVNFNPSPLSFDKVAIFEQHDKRNLTGASPQYLNVQQNSQVRNTSPTPFGIAFNEQTSRSPSSLGSGGSPHLPKTGSSRCGPTSSSATPSLNQGQTFNKCARGWGPISHNQEVYQSPYSLPISGNLPYSDF
ncbi:uncharacterized protein LOC108040061 isoform X10 [Drosophila rhopaloa]|uniref:Uncharacterized protein n=1 Tax=Drosophila rhopaloa TaxID=1041015 RepID=A0ABM5JCK7_DRORH|nr:uncharacterized protein LOC108040061 isoform X10 [Drosophila rhopaloa]